ncbi:hypothetical protein [Nocardiopsis potens]|uniref:hypothetical protein n=1 Tax=Nocardiopsis potens TaxID=1246458 RepID=UPI000345B278|nr:hypothetical protein [Nocardiopsis potens]
MDSDHRSAAEDPAVRSARIRAKAELVEGLGRAGAARRPPVSEEAVAAREAELGIAFPDSYRVFLTAVADGAEAFGTRIDPLGAACLWQDLEEWPDPDGGF